MATAKVVAGRPTEAVVAALVAAATPAVAAAHAATLGARPTPVGGLVVVATTRVLAGLTVEAVAVAGAAGGARAPPTRPSLVAVAPGVLDGDSSCCALGQTRRSAAASVAQPPMEICATTAVRVTRQAASTQRDGAVRTRP